MSATSDPSAPRRLPAPRSPVRRIGKKPVVIGVSLVALLIGSGVYVMTHLNSEPGVAPPSAPSTAADKKGLPDVLQNAPHGPLNVGRMAPDPSPSPGLDHDRVAPPKLGSVPTGGTTPAVPLRVAPGMTQTELAARKAAWEAYAQALAASQSRMATDEQSAFSGDAHASVVTQAGGAAGGGGGLTTQGTVLPTSLAPSGLNGSGGPGGFGEASSPDTDYLAYGVTLPVSRYELKAGDVIPFKTDQGLTNQTPGTFRAVVSANVLDHATGLHILIPQGSRLVGTYDTAQVNGDERIPAAITRVIYPPPGDESLDLSRMVAADQSGFSGFHDQVDNHTFELLFNALILGAIGAATQLSQPQSSSTQYGGGYSSQQVIAGSLGQQFGQVGAAYAQKGLNVKPTLTIRPGFSGVLELTKDIAFAKPWHPSSGPVTAAGAAR